MLYYYGAASGALPPPLNALPRIRIVTWGIEFLKALPRLLLKALPQSVPAVLEGIASFAIGGFAHVER